jgi:hypothetical protein
MDAKAPTEVSHFDGAILRVGHATQPPVSATPSRFDVTTTRYALISRVERPHSRAPLCP